MKSIQNQRFFLKRRNLIKNFLLGMATAATGIVAYTHRGPKTEIGGIASGSHDHHKLPFYTRGRQFLIGNRVRVSQQHHLFDYDAEAIIAHAHRSQYRRLYQLLVMRDGVPCDKVSWYDESDLTMIDDDCNLGCALLAWYDENR